MRNFLLRMSVFFVIMFAAILIPVFLFYPNFKPDEKIFFIVFTVIFSIILSFVFIFINYKMIVTPIRSINDASQKITDGAYNTRIKMSLVDQEVMTLSYNINSIATEFENLEQMRKSFVANASHELRSPLTSMQGFLQAMLDGTITSEEERSKYLTIVLSETKRLSSLINSMLDLSRMESGKSPMTLSRFEINEIIVRIIERFEPNLKKKEIQLDVDFVKETTFVFADKDKIIQVIINLIDNAVKYSPHGARILVTTHIHGKKVYITVKDKGFGISKKDQLMIWDRFFMADKARTPAKGKGTGLGLSIVKKIIDEHKEVIWVESSKGSGATFIFTLTMFDNKKHLLPQEGEHIQSGNTIDNIDERQKNPHIPQTISKNNQ